MTLGQLVDALSIVNLKIWAAQDQIFEAARQDPEEYAQRSPRETQEIFVKVASLNLDRSRLVREIDEFLAEAVATGQVEVSSQIKFT